MSGTVLLWFGKVIILVLVLCRMVSANCTDDQILKHFTSSKLPWDNYHRISKAVYPPAQLPSLLIKIRVKFINESSVSNSADVCDKDTHKTDENYTWSMACLYVSGGEISLLAMNVFSLGTILPNCRRQAVPDLCIKLPQSCQRDLKEKKDEKMIYFLSKLQSIAIRPTAPDPSQSTVKCVTAGHGKASFTGIKKVLHGVCWSILIAAFFLSILASQILMVYLKETLKGKEKATTGSEQRGLTAATGGRRGGGATTTSAATAPEELQLIRVEPEERERVTATTTTAAPGPVPASAGTATTTTTTTTTAPVAASATTTTTAPMPASATTTTAPVAASTTTTTAPMPASATTTTTTTTTTAPVPASAGTATTKEAAAKAIVLLLRGIVVLELVSFLALVYFLRQDMYFWSFFMLILWTVWYRYKVEGDKKTMLDGIDYVTVYLSLFIVCHHLLWVLFGIITEPFWAFAVLVAISPVFYVPYFPLCEYLSVHSNKLTCTRELLLFIRSYFAFLLVIFFLVMVGQDLFSEGVIASVIQSILIFVFTMFFKYATSG